MKWNRKRRKDVPENAQRNKYQMYFFQVAKIMCHERYFKSRKEEISTNGRKIKFIIFFLAKENVKKICDNTAFDLFFLEDLIRTSVLPQRSTHTGAVINGACYFCKIFLVSSFLAWYFLCLRFSLHVQYKLG